jgi:hypothetical protein
LVNRTCEEATGATCQQFGVQTSFDHPVGCCNSLATQLKDVSFDNAAVRTPNAPGGGGGRGGPVGICAPYAVGSNGAAPGAPGTGAAAGTYAGAHTGLPVGRRLKRSPSATGRRRGRALTGSGSRELLQVGTASSDDDETLWPLQVCGVCLARVSPPLALSGSASIESTLLRK